MAVITSTSERLKLLRKKQGITQAELADSINVSRESVAKWESTSGIIPRTADVIALADYYGVSCDYILRGYTPEHLTTIRDLALSDDAVNGLRELKETNRKSRGIISALFDRQCGAMYYMLDHLDNALELQIAQIKEQQRIDDTDECVDPKLHIGGGTEVEYDMIIKAMIREASEAFVQTAHTYVIREAKKYAEKNHP